MSRRFHRAAAPGSPSRREFLVRSGLLAGGVLLTPSLLAACGDDESSSGGGGGSPSEDGGAGPKGIAISNWTAYMDGDDGRNSPLLEQFEAETGIAVKYVVDINDNIEYFNKVRPDLQAKRSINRDGFVLTDWMANRMINQAQWTQELVDEAFPNKANLQPALASPSFDPERKSSVPWASGVGGIAYNLDLTGGKEIRTLDDFLAAEGTKTVLSEMRDTIGLFMLADGKDITKPSFEDAQGAFDALQEAVNDGQISGFNGNDYVTDLGNGNLTAAIGWSGDVAQITLENPSIRFAVPESGGTLWSDNFMIPYTSTKAEMASQFLNFFYDPVIAARLTAAIQYISPVAGVADELVKMGGEAAALVENPLVVPTAEFLETVSIFGGLDREEEKQFEERFAEILGTG